MSKLKMSKLFADIGSELSKHSPKILLGVGIAGMITTTVLAVRATPKALMLLEDARYEKDREELTVPDVVKACWKPYVPAAVTGLASIGCLIGSNAVNSKRMAALAAAYQLSETAFSEYKEKVVETIGEKKERTVREKISEERVKQATTGVREVYPTGRGTSLFLEPTCNQLFESDIEFVRRAVNNINERMLHDICGSASLGEFYDELGLERSDICTDIGWNTDRLLKVDFHPSMTSDMRPCLALYYETPPRYGFDKFM